VDRIVDVDFGGNLSTTIQVLKPDGVVASYATRGEPEPKVPFRALMVKNLTVRAILVYTMSEAAKTAASQDITRTLESGALRPIIGQRLRLEDIAQAHTDVERGSIIGNTVLTLA
jgi:NADPH2:quinone reductase